MDASEPKVPEMFIPTEELAKDVDILRDIYYGTLGTEREKAVLRRLASRYRNNRHLLIINRVRTKLINSWGAVVASEI